MKIKELVAVIDQASHISDGERARLLARLVSILSKLPADDTVTKALKKRA